MTDHLGSTVRVLSSVASSDFPDEWYELAAEGHFWLEWRFRAFANQLATLGVSVDAPWHGLDVGCGHGMVRRQIEHATAWTTDGADLNVGALEQNRTRSGESFVYDIHDRRAELAGRYDFVVLFDVIEHLDEPGPFLDSALHHLKPGGWLFVNVPALASMRSTYDDAVGHVRRYSAPTLRAELAPYALEIRDVRYWGFSMLPYLVVRKLNALRGQGVGKVIERGILPPKAWMNAWIVRIMRCETRWLRNPPLGTSLLAAAVKR
jgi:SAM-dependent methyltransferase